MKQRIINEIIKREGGYVNDPLDSGGETMYGITVAVARAFGYHGPMDGMPRSVAERVYSAKYWDVIRGDGLAELSTLVAEELADTSVNMGPKRAGRFLQRSLNVLNDRSRAYKDLVVDGAIGPATLWALKMYLARRDEATLVKMLNCLQGAYYVELAERREKDEKFIYGWFRNRVTL